MNTIFNASAERKNADTIQISWDAASGPVNVRIFTGTSPDSIDRSSPAVTKTGDCCAEIAGLDPGVRHYFYLVPDSGPAVMTAERLVPLEGTDNFRDMGGYETSQGRRVKWGRVFRSGSLSKLTDTDLNLFQQMNIGIVCDFRTATETEKEPDCLPRESTPEYLHLPLTHGAIDAETAAERINNQDISWISHDIVLNGYLENIDKYAHLWGTVISRLAAADCPPLVFHCTAGKDRTGTCAALLLLALDVPEETVIKDYELSNVFLARMFESAYVYFRKAGIDPDVITPLLFARRENMDALIEHIKKNYGSASAYLTSKAGVQKADLSVLEDALLE